jgi:signal peptide peptidase SppA
MYELIADRAFNTPLLVTPQRLDIVTTVLLQRMGLMANDLPAMQPDSVVNDERPNMYQVPDTAVYNRDGGYYVDGNIGILNIFGTMIHRGGFMDALSGITSYDTISRRIDRIGNDPQVKVVLGNFDTPGGEVAGAFDLADKWKKLAEVKPAHALVSEMAASAGYLIASGSTQIHTTQTGQTGSIGVVMKHIEFSKFNQRVGVKPTFIFAGDRKVEGNQEETLPAEVLARFQEKINTIYDMFVNVTSNNRSIDAQAIIDTQAEIYMGEAAIEAGLVDSVTTGDALLERLKQENSTHRLGVQKTTSMETQNMTTENKKSAGAETKVINLAVGGLSMPSSDVIAAITSVVEGAEVSLIEGQFIEGQLEELKDDAVKAIETAAVTAERLRMATILTSEVAASRMQSAIALATETSVDADEAITTLGKLPADAKTEGGKLKQIMETVDKPEVGADVGAGDLTDTQRITAAHKTATGRK